MHDFSHREYFHLICHFVSFSRKTSNEPKASQQSHLMDLLDISLGATSISNAAPNSDPWSIPAPKDASSHRAGIVDPWQSTSNGGAIAKQPMPSVDSWLPRTHSPSVASGSSNEGWLQNNGASNGNLVGNIGAGAVVNDPWLSKGQKQATVPDPWLNNTSNPVSDAWQPASQANKVTSASAVSDPWAPVSASIG